MEIDGQHYDIRAQVHARGSSPRENQKVALGVVIHVRHWPQEVRIVYCDPEVKAWPATPVADALPRKG